MNSTSVIIEQLGGVTYTTEFKTSCDFDQIILERLTSYLDVLPDEELTNFIQEYGFSYFTDQVGIIPKELPPLVTKVDPMCPVGMFFGFGESKNSIFNILETYHKEDQISINFFPICDGLLGDIILASLEHETFGKIYYWHHESDIDDDLFLIADNFIDFIQGLKPIQEKAEVKKSAVKRTFISPKMLELMNKTRADNGLPPMTMEDALG